jgi:protoheme ferro-lyase
MPITRGCDERFQAERVEKEGRTTLHMNNRHVCPMCKEILGELKHLMLSPHVTVPLYIQYSGVGKKWAHRVEMVLIVRPARIQWSVPHQVEKQQ